MSDIFLPFAVGDVATAWSSDDLGKTYKDGDKLYRLVKASAAVATGSDGLAYYIANTGGVPNYKATPAASDTIFREVGVLGTEFASATMATSDYFLLQIAGPCKFKVTATTIATKSWLVIASDYKFKAAGTGFGTFPNLGSSTNVESYSTIGLVVGFCEDADVNSTSETVPGYLCSMLLPGLQF